MIFGKRKGIVRLLFQFLNHKFPTNVKICDLMIPKTILKQMNI